MDAYRDCDHVEEADDMSNGDDHIDGDSDDVEGARSKFGFRVPRKSPMPARRSTLWDSVSDEVHLS